MKKKKYEKQKNPVSECSMDEFVPGYIYQMNERVAVNMAFDPLLTFKFLCNVIALWIIFQKKVSLRTFNLIVNWISTPLSVLALYNCHVFLPKVTFC